MPFDPELIYFDHNATSPVHPAVTEAMIAVLRDGFGNPSSLHWFGQQARRAVDRARCQVADLIGADPQEVVFVSGGTEADNFALRGVIEHEQVASPRLIVSAVEHLAVFNPAMALEARGTELVTAKVDHDGLIDLLGLESALKNETTLVSIMLANNDVGTLQPVAEVTRLVQAAGGGAGRPALVHTDAVQAAGKVPVDVKALGVDLLSISGHKLGGPKGIGALYIREGTPMAPLISGGHHERRRRAGTENTAGIVGFGEACAIAQAQLQGAGAKVAALRGRLERGLLERVPGAYLNGHPELRLPNTVNLGFSGVDGQALLLNLDLEGIAVSNGSACTASSRDGSYVLIAMGRSPAQALESVRFSLGPGNTEAEVDRVIEAAAHAVGLLAEG